MRPRDAFRLPSSDLECAAPGVRRVYGELFYSSDWLGQQTLGDGQGSGSSVTLISSSPGSRRTGPRSKRFSR
jgi:hypothetical protein